VLLRAEKQPFEQNFNRLSSSITHRILFKSTFYERYCTSANDNDGKKGGQNEYGFHPQWAHDLKIITLISKSAEC
jgi:hypothetical protein